MLNTQLSRLLVVACVVGLALPLPHMDPTVLDVVHAAPISTHLP